jgi:hypothetical protein
MTTYRGGGAEGIGAGSVTPWTAPQCQWVHKRRCGGGKSGGGTGRGTGGEEAEAAVGGIGATTHTGGDAVAVRRRGHGDMWQRQTGSGGDSRGHDRDGDRGGQREGQEDAAEKDEA